MHWQADDDTDDDRPDAERSRDSLLWEYGELSELLNRRDIDPETRREAGRRAAVLRRLLGGDP